MGVQAVARQVAFSPDGKKLVVHSDTFTFDLYDRRTRKRDKRLVLSRDHKVRVSPRAMLFTPDGKTVVLAGYGQGVGIFLWEPATGKVRGDFNKKSAVQHKGAALSKDGKALATGGRSVQLWDLTPPKKDK